MTRPPPRNSANAQGRRGMAGPRLLGALAVLGLAAAVALSFCLHRGGPSSVGPSVRTFIVKGTIQKIEPEQRTIVIAHGAIPAYMDAMTMPFKARRAQEMSG